MTPEGKVKAKVAKFLKTVPDCYSFTPVGSMYGRAGVPDIIVCHEGRFVGIEVKAPGKLSGQTALQKYAQTQIEQAGGVYLLVDDVLPVVAFFHSKGA